MVIACPKIASRSAPSRTLILMPLIAFVFANLLYDSRETKLLIAVAQSSFIPKLSKSFGAKIPITLYI